MTTLKITRAFLVLSVSFLIYADQARATSSADIKKKITAQDADKYIGIGGRYGKLVDTVSKDRHIEIDRFPPKSTYAYARDKKIREIKERDMGAVSISYAVHRNQQIGEARVWREVTNKQLADHFRNGRYYEAIRMTIQVYANGRFFDQIKKGVMDALSVHEENGLITDAQREALIKDYKLDSYDKDFEKDHDRMEAVAVVHG